MTFENFVKASQINPATSGRRTGRDKYRRTCGSHGHLWSMTYYPVALLAGEFAFQICERCHNDIRWMV